MFYVQKNPMHFRTGEISSDVLKGTSTLGMNPLSGISWGCVQSCLTHQGCFLLGKCPRRIELQNRGRGGFFSPSFPTLLCHVPTFTRQGIDLALPPWLLMSTSFKCFPSPQSSTQSWGVTGPWTNGHSPWISKLTGPSFWTFLKSWLPCLTSSKNFVAACCPCLTTRAPLGIGVRVPCSRNSDGSASPAQHDAESSLGSFKLVDSQVNSVKATSCYNLANSFPRFGACWCNAHWEGLAVPWDKCGGGSANPRHLHFPNTNAAVSPDHTYTQLPLLYKSDSAGYDYTVFAQHCSIILSTVPILS